MTRRNNRRSRQGNKIQNVRVVDPDEAQDNLKVSRVLTSMTSSNSQTRIICGYRGELGAFITGGGTISFAELTSTDDWTTFSSQFTEFRVRAVQFRIFDIQPNANNINFWATYHTVGGTVATAADDVVDRPDARVIAPGAGWIELDWAAHGQPEMEFQSIGSFTSFGGLVYNISGPTAATGVKYQIVGKYVVDFRGRR